MAETPPSPHDKQNDQWRLGTGLSAAPAAPAPQTPVRVSAKPGEVRLARPIYVVTVEHLGWLLLAVWTILTRMAALGARPIDAPAARRALLALAISRDGMPALGANQTIHATWIDIAQGWIFATVGASDASSRIVVAACGLILVATAFAMRPQVGRAGALALAGFLALSPSVTYFSLGGSQVVASMAFMMVAIVVAASMTRRPTATRAIALGCAIALWLTADPIGYPTALAAIWSLVIVGLFNAMRVDHPRLRARVWWERRRVLVLITTAVAIALWICLTTAFFNYSLTTVVVENVRSLYWRAEPGFGIFVLAPIAIFYEFAIVVFAGCGVLVAFRQRTGFMRWLLVWSLFGTAEVILAANRPGCMVALLIAPAILAAIGIDWIFQSARWNSLRYPAAALAALTLYVQMITNFVHAAPNTNEAAWDRHALLFWSEPATSVQTARECARAENAVTAADATAAIPTDAPQVAWYLRRFVPAATPESASIVVTVGKTVAGSSSGNPDSPEFGFEESWSPDFTKLTALKAVRYFFTQRAWSDVEIRDLSIQVRGNSGAGPGTRAANSSPLQPQ